MGQRNDGTSGAIYYCEVCNKSYKYRESLYNHTKYECGKEPQFQCPHCPHKTKRKGFKKPSFFCPECERSYYHLSSLERHLKKHSPVECPLCNTYFRGKNILQNHALHEHI